MKKGKAVIFTGGFGPDAGRVEKVLEEAEIIIAADSGWDSAVSMGICPGLYIGDMDSVEDHAGLQDLPVENRIIHPVDKDYTDTELALKFLEERDYRDIVLIGGGGGRIDHLLANRALFSRDGRPLEWYTADEHIIFTDDDCIVECGKGRTVSFFSCSGGEAVVSTEGMKWELDNFLLDSVKFSLSNTALDNCFRLVVHSGALLIILNY